MEIITYAIPLFFLSIGIEVLYARVCHLPLYRLTDSISDLGCGILSQLTGLAFVFLTIGLYTVVYDYARLATLPSDASVAGMAVWVLALLAVDHQYYWFHRMSHEWQLLWASHSVHHQSEEYNLTVALRQSATPFFGWPFYLPLAIVGIAPEVFAASYSLNLVYQFFIHTRAVGKLHPWIEAVMNTPSHHRVHHGKNPKYCDRNHAGALIIWDRLYGTFVMEEEEPVYGVTVPLNSWNPLWANVIGYWHLAQDMWRTRSWRDKLRVPFMPPGWRPADVGEAIRPREVDVATHRVFETPAPRVVHGYAFAQFVLVIPVALLVLLQVSKLQPLYTWGLGLYVAWTLINLSALYERKSWRGASEALRLMAMLALAGVLLFNGQALLAAGVGGQALASTAGLWQALRAQQTATTK